MRRIVSIAIILGLTTGFVEDSTAQSGQPAVAVVAGEAIPAEVFRTRYIDYLLKTGLADTSPRRAAFLNRLIRVKLIVQEAKAGGITEAVPYSFEKEGIYRKLLLDLYTRRVLYDTVEVTQPDREAMFVRVNTRLTARHLYARTRTEAEALYTRLQAGESFEALAQDVFADTTLAHNGGLIGTFGFDEMDPAFEDAAYALGVGEVSAPVRTAQGYSIIRLEDRFTKPVLTETEYAQRRDKLERYVRYRKQQAARTHHLHDLAAQAQVQFHEPTLARLLAQVTGQTLAPDAEAWPAWLAEPLLSFTTSGGRQTWTVADFGDRAQYTSEPQRAQVRTREDLAEFARGLVVREAMLARAEAAGLNRLPVFEQALHQAMADWVYEQAFSRLMATMPQAQQDQQAYLRAYAEALREKATVHVYPDVLAAVRLTKNASS